MGVMQRFKDIMSANINSVLDKAEDPEKMIDQYARDLQNDLGKVKAETAAVMAEETRAKRERDECKEEVDKFQTYAEKAVKMGNDSDARQFLEKKNQATQKLTGLQQAYEAANANASKMRQMHDKLVNDMNELEERKAAIKSKLAVAKAQEKVNKMGGSLTGAADSMSAFDRMEAKADKMLDQANAMSELNSSSSDNDVEDLMTKYDVSSAEDGMGGNSAVDDELAALKAQMDNK